MTNPPGTAPRAELVVLSTLSAHDALIDLVPTFERTSGIKFNITYTGAVLRGRRYLDPRQWPGTTVCAAGVERLGEPRLG